MQTHAGHEYVAIISVISSSHQSYWSLEGLSRLVSSIPSSSDNLSFSYSSGLPKPRGKGFNRDNPFITDCANVSHSLHFEWLWVFDYCYQHQGKDSLVIAEKENDLSIKDYH